MATRVAMLNKSNISSMAIAFIVSLSLTIFICSILQPHWETVDDVGMSMLAHGYGYGPHNTGTPHLMYSNILWGHLVRGVPSFFYIPGYSWATYAVLVLFGSVLIYGLRVVRVGWILTLALWILTLIRPVLFPQFTINAGLLAVGAIICWKLYENNPQWPILWLGGTMAWASYLVRADEFFLVFLVALPLLPWKVLIRDQHVRWAMLGLLGILLMSEMIHRQAHQTKEWIFYKEMHQAIRPFVDYSAGAHLKEHPAMLQAHGFTINDIDLIGSWFFADSSVINPKRLQAMLKEFGSLAQQGKPLERVLFNFGGFWHSHLRVGALLILFMGIIIYSKRYTSALFLLLMAIVIIAIMGRPRILRIYVPLLILLQISPFLLGPILHGWRHKLVATLVLVATALQSLIAIQKSTLMSTSKPIELAEQPPYQVFIWQGADWGQHHWPLAPPLTTRFCDMSMIFWHPHSESQQTWAKENSFREMLMKPEGIPIYHQGRNLLPLHIYCSEHLGGKLVHLRDEIYGHRRIPWYQCVVE